MTVFMTATALFLLLMTGLLVNQGGSVLSKERLQNRADSVAQATGKRQAADLEHLQAIEHLIGEAIDWAEQPEALAGRNVSADDLPEPDRMRAKSLAARLAALASGLQARGLATPGATTLGQPINSGATTGQGKLRLLGLIVEHYEARLVAGSPPDQEEFQLITEWQALTTFEDEARKCLSAKLYLEEQALPDQIEEARRVVDQSGPATASLAASMGTPGLITTGLWPASPPLPVRPEAFDLTTSDLVPSITNSVLVRAAWPWVLYDRRPVRKRLEPLVRAQAAAIFDVWTVEATAAVVRRLYNRTRQPLYDYDPMNVGLLGLAYRLPPSNLAARLYPPPEVGGLLTHAQARPHDDQPGASRTLINWSVTVAGYPDLAPDPAPLYHSTWRARLVPVTLFDEAAPGLAEPFHRPAARLGPVPRVFQTH